MSSPLEVFEISSAVEANGWDPISLSPQQIMKLYKSDTKAPATAKPAPPTTPPAAATDDELVKIKAAFPGMTRKPDAEGVEAWRELIKLGGVDAIQKGLARCSNPEMQSAAASSPEKTLRIVQRQNGADAALQGVTITDDRLLDAKQATIKSLADMLPEPQKTAIKTSADALRGKGDRAGLDKTHDRVGAVLAKLMLKEIEGLVARCRTEVAADKLEEALYELGNAKKDIEGGGHLDARGAIDAIKRRNNLT